MVRKTLLLSWILSLSAIMGTIGLVSCTGDSTGWRATSDAADAADNIHAVGVEVKQLERHDLFRKVVLPASVEAFEQVTLYAKVAGYLKWIKVDIGDRVRKGQVLAEIDVPEMVDDMDSAEAEVKRARARVANAQAELERAKAEAELKKITYQRLRSVREEEPDVLPQQKVDEASAQYSVARAIVDVAESQIQVAESDVDRAVAARGRLVKLTTYATIRAPFTGVVTKRYVHPGALIQHALSQTNVSPIVTVARVDRVRVLIDIAEPEVPFVNKGNRVSFTVDALPGKVFEGTCTRIATALDPKTRTMRAEIDIANRDGRLRPGMYGKATVALDRREHVLTLPAGALIIEGGKSYVFLVDEGVAKRVEVETGLHDGIQVEITNGLTGNESVVVTGQNALSDGAPVVVREERNHKLH